MILLALVLLALIATGGVLVARAVNFTRLRTAEQVRTIGAYGFNSVPVAPVGAAADGPSLAGLAGAVGSLVAGLFIQVKPEALRRDIMAAGLYRLTPHALLGYRALGLAAMATFGFTAGSGAGAVMSVLLGVSAALLGWMAPLVLVRRRGRLRREAIDLALPDLIDLLVVTVEAGQGLGSAMQMAAHKVQGPLADELRLTLQEHRMGRALGEALDEMLSRCDTASMRSFVRSITQGESLGVSIATILRNLAVEMRKRRRAAAEQQAQKAPVKMLFPMIFLILPALFVVILGPAIFTIIETLGGG